MANNKTFTAYGHSDAVIDRFNNLVALYDDSSLLDMINHALCDEEIAGICEYIEDRNHEGVHNTFNKIVKVIDTSGLDENTLKLIEPTMAYTHNYVENETTFAVLHNSKGETIRIFPERLQEFSVAPEITAGSIANRLEFIKEDVSKVIGILPKDVLATEHDGVSVLTLLLNIEIATDLNDNESDNWKLGVIISAVPESNNKEVLTATEKVQCISNTDYKTFEEKVAVLFSLMDKYSLYQQDDEVGQAVEDIKKDIVIVTPEKTPFQLAIEQIELQEKVQRESSVNIVTCGHCGQVLLHKIGETDIQCVSCNRHMALSDCPDLWYRGVENNYQ